jgi:hypothetical protein
MPLETTAFAQFELLGWLRLAGRHPLVCTADPLMGQLQLSFSHLPSAPTSASAAAPRNAPHRLRPLILAVHVLVERCPAASALVDTVLHIDTWMTHHVAVSTGPGQTADGREA